MIDVENFRFELALKTVNNEFLDMDEKLDYWLYNFDIKHAKLCEKYKIENRGYNFYLYIVIRKLYNNGHERKRILTQDHIFYLGLCRKIESYLFVAPRRKLLVLYGINCKNETQEKMYNFYENQVEWLNSTPIFNCYNPEFIVDFFNLYNLQIRFKSPAKRYISVRKIDLEKNF